MTTPKEDLERILKTDATKAEIAKALDTYMTSKGYFIVYAGKPAQQQRQHDQN